MFVPASSVPLATSSVILSEIASPSDSATLSLSGAAKMCFTTTDAASFSRGSRQYLRDCLAQRDAKLAKLDDKYIQRVEFFIFLEACLADPKSQLAASRSDYDSLQATNDDLRKC